MTHPLPLAVSRRGFLRGAGVALALPWLESMRVRAAESGKLEAANGGMKPPVRFACIYFSNGVEPAHWWAKQEGDSMRLGACLEPLLSHREEIVFLRGLFNAQAVANSSPRRNEFAGNHSTMVRAEDGASSGSNLPACIALRTSGVAIKQMNNGINTAVAIASFRMLGSPCIGTTA